MALVAERLRPVMSDSGNIGNDAGGNENVWQRLKSYKSLIGALHCSAVEQILPFGGGRRLPPIRLSTKRPVAEPIDQPPSNSPSPNIKPLLPSSFMKSASQSMIISAASALESLRTNDEPSSVPSVVSSTSMLPPIKNRQQAKSTSVMSVFSPRQHLPTASRLLQFRQYTPPAFRSGYSLCGGSSVSLPSYKPPDALYFDPALILFLNAAGEGNYCVTRVK